MINNIDIYTYYSNKSDIFFENLLLSKKHCIVGNFGEKLLVYCVQAKVLKKNNFLFTIHSLFKQRLLTSFF